MRRVVAISRRLGVTKVRLTGGEPLLRKGLVDFIVALKQIEGLTDISLTTNGILLAKMAEEIKAAGIKRINVSLDSLNGEKYAHMTGGGDLARVLAGIYLAHDLGIAPIKINSVSIKGFNDDEILDFAALAWKNPFQVRFIELMPVGPRQDLEGGEFLSNEEVFKTIAGRYRLTEQIPPRGENAGPARIYRMAGGRGEIGFISPLSHVFCGSCNRLRLTADGSLLSCLLSPEGIELKRHLRAGLDDEELTLLVKKAVLIKPGRHLLDREEGRMRKCGRPMNSIGG
jgi:cyclic pyranopterin phosphate synthase